LAAAGVCGGVHRRGWLHPECVGAAGCLWRCYNPCVSLFVGLSPCMLGHPGLFVVWCLWELPGTAGWYAAADVHDRSVCYSAALCDWATNSEPGAPWETVWSPCWDWEGSGPCQTPSEAPVPVVAFVACMRWKSTWHGYQPFLGGGGKAAEGGGGLAQLVCAGDALAARLKGQSAGCMQMLVSHAGPCNRAAALHGSEHPHALKRKRRGRAEGHLACRLVAGGGGLVVVGS
jgi:hypothetical protein